MHGLALVFGDLVDLIEEGPDKPKLLKASIPSKPAQRKVCSTRDVSQHVFQFSETVFHHLEEEVLSPQFFTSPEESPKLKSLLLPRKVLSQSPCPSSSQS